MKSFNPPVVDRHEIDEWRDARRACKKTRVGPSTPLPNAHVIDIAAGCTTNPGLADKVLIDESGAPNLTRVSDSTNNRAAWDAFLDALRKAPGGDAHVTGVNKIVVDQAAGIRRCKDEVLQEKLAAFEKLLPDFTSVTLVALPRKQHAAGKILDQNRKSRHQAHQAHQAGGSVGEKPR